MLKNTLTLLELGPKLTRSILYLLEGEVFFTHTDEQYSSHTTVNNTNFDHKHKSQNIRWCYLEFPEQTQVWALTTVTGHATLLTTWLLTLPIIILLRPPRPLLPITRLERGICSAAAQIFSRGSPQYIFITTVTCTCFTIVGLSFNTKPNTCCKESLIHMDWQCLLLGHN